MIEMEMNQDLSDILKIEIETVENEAPICPILLGEPGIGKSSMVKSMCDENNWNFHELLCNQLGDRADLTGCRPLETEEEVNGLKEKVWKQIFFPHQAVQDAITDAKNYPDEITVLFLDEINRTSSDITSAILSFTTAKTVGSYKFPDNIRFIVAGNDKGNVQPIDTASISRFAKYKLKPSAQTWMKITPNVNPYIRQVLQMNPSYIFCKSSNIVTSTVNDGDGDDYTSEYEAFDDTEEGFEQITTPRTISGLNAFLNACDLQKLSYFVGQITRDPDTGEEYNLLQTIVQGHVGQTVFADALCAVIAQDVSKGLLQKANTIVAPTKPSIYKDIMRCSDRDTRNTMLDSLSDDDKSAILVYAVWEKGVDNKDLITAVANHFGGQLLTNQYQPQFSNLKSHDELDPDNYDALINSGTPLGVMIRNVLGE